MKQAFTFLLLGCALMYATERSICKVVRLSTYTIGISCLNGAAPTGNKQGDTVIMSCRQAEPTK